MRYHNIPHLSHAGCMQLLSERSRGNTYGCKETGWTSTYRLGSDRNIIFNVRKKINVMQLNIRIFCQNILNCSVKFIMLVVA